MMTKVMMKRWKSLFGFSVLCLLLSVTLVFSAGLSPRDYQALDAYRKKLVENNADAIETRMAIATNFLEVKNGTMDVDTFYRSLSPMEMPVGKDGHKLEPRHALMLVKKDIGNYLGTSAESFGQGYFFGETLQTVNKKGETGGGSQVERTILESRRKIVLEAVEKVLGDFVGRNVVDNVKYPSILWR